MTLKAHLEQLKKKHNLLDKKIDRELAHPNVNSVRITEMKKKKMMLKDQMENLNNR